MGFKHVIVDKETPGIQNDVCLIADVNGNGFNDIVIGGKRYEGNLVWYEYPNWERHLIGTASLEAGGVMIDLTGNGLLDFVGGHPNDVHPEPPGTEMFWFENSGDPDKPWRKFVIDASYPGQHHDQTSGDVDGDGKDEIVFACQQAGVIGYFDIPDDPRVTPWPDSCKHVFCDDLLSVEGLAVADLDGDGVNEVLAGPYWFKNVGGSWDRRIIDASYVKTTAAVGDLNGDGLIEVVLAEGESHPARLTWFGNAPYYDEPHVLADDLFHPHSLAVADMTGNGLLDIFVGEMGLGSHPGKPEIIIFYNNGDGTFTKTVIDEDKPTHCAKVGDIGKSGRLSIVGKPYDPGQHVEMWLNEG